MLDLWAVTLKKILIALVIPWIVLNVWNLYCAWTTARQVNKHFPSSPAHWFFGHLFNEPFDHGLKWLLEETQRYSKCFVLWLGPFHHFVFITDPEIFRVVLTSSEGVFNKSHEIYQFVSNFVGKYSLVTMPTGSRWTRHRKLLTRCFHFNLLREYAKAFNSSVDIFLQILQDHEHTKRPVPMFEYAANFAMDSLLKAAFSFDSNCQIEKTEICTIMKIQAEVCAMRAGNAFMANNLIFFCTPYFWFNWRAKRRFRSLQRNILLRKRTEVSQNPNDKPSDFMETLLLAEGEEGNGLSEEEIIDEMNTFLFAGHDTTASAITFFLYIMCKYPEEQRKVQTEIDQVIDDGKKHIHWEALPRLEYLTMCIKESLRCYSQAPSGRSVLVECKIDGRNFPKNTMLFLSPYLLHHNPKVWGEDHMEFKPDRFLPENVGKRHNFAYLPFLAGQRNCIGQNFAMLELKICLARILKEYSVTLEKDSELHYAILAKPKEEFWINFISRDDSK